MSDVGPFGDIEETLAHRRAEHHVLRETSEWKAASRYLGHVVEDFVALVNAAAWAFTRYPDGHKWLLQSAMDEFVESAVGCLFLADSGALNVAQRELRYVLEVAVKYTHVDQSVDADSALTHRIQWLHTNVDRSGLASIDKLTWFVLDPADAAKAREEALNLYGLLSSHIHPSLPHAQAQFQRAKGGEYLGFETPKRIREVADLYRRVYDVVGALILNGVGAQFAGDVLELWKEDTKWVFSKTRFVGKGVTSRLRGA